MRYAFMLLISLCFIHQAHAQTQDAVKTTTTTQATVGAKEKASKKSTAKKSTAKTKKSETVSLSLSDKDLAGYGHNPSSTPSAKRSSGSAEDSSSSSATRRRSGSGSSSSPDPLSVEGVVAARQRISGQTNIKRVKATGKSQAYLDALEKQEELIEVNRKYGRVCDELREEEKSKYPNKTRIKELTERKKELGDQMDKMRGMK